MHGSRRSRRSSTALASAVLTATLLVVPATAGAATGTTSIALGGPAASGLKAQKVQLSASSPAKATAKRITLPVASGSLTATNANVAHGGSLRLKAGKRSVTLTSLRVSFGKAPKVRARLGGSTVTFLTLKPAKGKGVRLDVARKTVTLKGAAATLPTATARKLAKQLKLRKLAGGRIGTVTVTADLTVPAPKPAPLPAPAPAPVPRPIDPGVPPTAKPTECPSPLPARDAVADQIGDATWTMRSSWITYLVDGKGCVVGTNGAGATAGDQQHSVFAVTGSTVDGAGTTTITTKGTVAFVYPTHFLDIRVTDPTFTIKADGTGTVVADGQGSGSMSNAVAGHAAPEPFTRLHVFDIQSSSVADSSTGRTWSDVTLTVAAGDASRIFSYPAGAPYGTFTLTAARPAVPVPASVWHLRESWVNYLTGAGGTITGENGASIVDPANKYEYQYGAATARTAADGTVTIEQPGLIRYTMVSHGIDTTITNPTVVVAPGGASAKVITDGQYGSQANPGTQTPYSRLSILNLNLSGVTPVLSADGKTKRYVAPATITADGAGPLSYAENSAYGTFAFSVPVN